MRGPADQRRLPDAAPQRRGRIVLGAALSQVDPFLAKNVLTAQRWYAAIKACASRGDFAAREKTATSRIPQMIGLAFLAPDVLDQVAAGRPPFASTSGWVKRRQTFVSHDSGFKSLDVRSARMPRKLRSNVRS